MKTKSWDVGVLDNPNIMIATETDDFYTADTEAFLVFKLKDSNFNPHSALLTLVNQQDGSVISETVPVKNKIISYEMREEVIKHAGTWLVQLVYTQDKEGTPENYTSRIISFSVGGHLMDKKQPTLVAIENWESFILNAKDLLENWESQLQEHLEELLRGESERILNEDGRVAAENERQTNYNELVDTGVIQENINQKLSESEQTYAPRLTNLEQNDADLTAQLAHTVKRNENESIGMEMFKPEVKQALNDGEWNVNVNTSEIENGAVTIEKLSPQLQGIFIEEGKNWGVQ